MGNKRAYTLIEIMVVMAIFVFFCGLFAPLFVKAPIYVLESELDKLFMVLSYSQQKAMASGVAQRVSFDITKNEYSYMAPGGRVCVVTLSDPIILGFMDIAKGPPASPTLPLCKAVTFQHPDGGCYALCTPDGKITAGAVYVVDRCKKIMGAVTCGITPVACIRKYMYRDGKWVL